ncbi:hypothetical protein [Paraburkholderia sp. BL10I2N1]|uniref:hypothetical protein n=1 Tax=Paraburkholderia sp. BL10I2N1 TaxID=1938796 RepID=UPI001060A769|nr:hypothetical protein [Paraburkholderia sp. BL10I2N1]
MTLQLLRRNEERGGATNWSNAHCYDLHGSPDVRLQIDADRFLSNPIVSEWQKMARTLPDADCDRPPLAAEYATGIKRPVADGRAVAVPTTGIRAERSFHALIRGQVILRFVQRLRVSAGSETRG